MIFLTYSPAFSAGFQRSELLLGRLITIAGCGGDLMSYLQYLILEIDFRAKESRAFEKFIFMPTPPWPASEYCA